MEWILANCKLGTERWKQPQAKETKNQGTKIKETGVSRTWGRCMSEWRDTNLKEKIECYSEYAKTRPCLI